MADTTDAAPGPPRDDRGQFTPVPAATRAKPRFALRLDEATYAALRRRAQQEYPKSMSELATEAVVAMLRRPARRPS